jgi:hypothetical protein
MNNKLITRALLAAGLILACGSATAAEGQAATPPAAPTRPTTIPPASTKQGVTFDKDIKPLFEASCVKCHGAQKPKGNLRLDSLEGVLKGSEDGKVLVAGDGAKSKIVIAVARINPKSAMPPEPRGPRRGGPGGPGGEGRPAREGGGEGHAAAGAPEKVGEAAKAGEAPAHPPGGPGAPGGQGGRPQGPPAKPLTVEEVGLVRAWIDQGAK